MLLFQAIKSAPRLGAATMCLGSGGGVLGSGFGGVGVLGLGLKEFCKKASTLNPKP